MNSIINYYNSGKIKFGIAGDRLNKLLPIIAEIRDEKVFDVGCASGYLGKILKDNGNYVVGVDVSLRDILKAKKVLNEAHVADVENDSLGEPNTYDFIIVSEVVEHLFDPEKTLKKLVLTLKPGGKILLTTPNILHLYNRIKFVFGKFEYKEETVINQSHIHFFTYDSIRELAESTGLRIAKDSSLVFPRTLANIWKFWPSVFVHTTIIVCEKK